MQQNTRFSVEPNWLVFFKDIGLSPEEALIRAKLPYDLFARKNPTLTADEYFRLWIAVESHFDEEAFPLKMGQMIPPESFNPPLFASLCSPDINTAFSRLGQFKKLIGPMQLQVTIGKEATKIEVDCLYRENPVPRSLALTELVFLVNLARLATRDRIEPIEITVAEEVQGSHQYEEYFGVAPTLSKKYSVTFSARDAAKPFLTKNDSMWDYFEPEFRRRLSQLEVDASYAAKVKSALIELLPSGKHSINDVASQLAISRRTLQRRLQEESATFQEILNRTREGLARHYLATSDYTGAQISFLLGFDDPNSFFRAFNAWTGTTPERLRAASKQ